MFKTENIIGDIVFISFINVEDFKYIGISKSGHFLVKGFDQLGVWVLHPGLITKNDKIEKHIKEATFLIMWNQIATIMHYPNRDGYDFPSEFDKQIGFSNK